MNLVSRELLKLAFPILLSNWIYALQGFVVLLSISDLGEKVIAGVGFASTLIWLLYGIDETVYTGIAVLTASELGSGRKAGRFVFYGFLLSLLISLPFYCAGDGLFSRFMELFGVEGESLEAALSYTEPVILLLPLVLTTNSLNALLNGAGRTKEIFYGTLAVFCLNLLLLAFLVPKMGPEGAGLSVALSESLASIFYLYICFKDERLNPVKDMKLNIREVIDTVRTGLPVGVEETLSSLSYNVFTGLIATCGTEALAAFQVGLRIEGAASAVGFALMDAALPFIGQARRRKELLKERISLLTGSSLILGTTAGTLLLVASFPALRLFNLDGETRNLALVYLTVSALSQPFFTLWGALTGAMRALRKTCQEATVNIGSFWLLRILPSWLLLRMVKSPLVPWLFMALETAAKTLILKRLLTKEGAP